MHLGRSRKGAWIEIFASAVHVTTVYGRSRKGAWIEIASLHSIIGWRNVAPVRERGLKSHNTGILRQSSFVAPVRERGLKSLSR